MQVKLFKTVHNTQVTWYYLTVSWLDIKATSHILQTHITTGSTLCAECHMMFVKQFKNDISQCKNETSLPSASSMQNLVANIQKKWKNLCPRKARQKHSTE